MNKIIYSLIILTYCFSSNAETMYILGEKPASNQVRDFMSRYQAEQEAIEVYANKYPRECFAISYPEREPETRNIVSENRDRVVYDDGSVAYRLAVFIFRDEMAGMAGPIWQRHKAAPGITFSNNEQGCVDTRELFRSDFDFSDELLAHIGATVDNISPGRLEFLRHAKMYEAVSGNDYMERHNNLLNE